LSLLPARPGLFTIAGPFAIFHPLCFASHRLPRASIAYIPTLSQRRRGKRDDAGRAESHVCRIQRGTGRKPRPHGNCRRDGPLRAPSRHLVGCDSLPPISIPSPAEAGENEARLWVLSLLQPRGTVSKFPPRPPRAEYAKQLCVSRCQPPVPGMGLAGFRGDHPFRQLQCSTAEQSILPAAAAYGLIFAEGGSSDADRPPAPRIRRNSSRHSSVL
jgi:hypothetical protein